MLQIHRRAFLGIQADSRFQRIRKFHDQLGTWGRRGKHIPLGANHETGPPPFILSRTTNSIFLKNELQILSIFIFWSITFINRVVLFKSLQGALYDVSTFKGLTALYDLIIILQITKKRGEGGGQDDEKENEVSLSKQWKASLSFAQRRTASRNCCCRKSGRRVRLHSIKISGPLNKLFPSPSSY